MERDTVVNLVLARVGATSRTNPTIVRPPQFLSATFRAELMDVHPRSNGDVRVTLNCPYEDRHLVFALTDAWGANLRINITRDEEYLYAAAEQDRHAEESDRATGGGRRVVDLSHRRGRAGARPQLDQGGPGGGVPE